MERTLFVLLSLTTISGSLSQTTPSNGMPVPTTDCGKKALKCWTDQQTAMGTADATFDFTTGCKLYKAYEDCYDTVVKTAACAKESEVIAINEQTAADRGGICITDGTVAPCGRDLQACMQDVLDIKNAFARKDAAAACPVLDKFMECAEMTKNRPECASNLKVKDALDQAESSFNEDDLLVGCAGQCGIQIGRCLGNLTDVMVNGDFMNIDWKQFCRDAFTAVDCVYSLSTNSNCTGNSEIKSVTDSQRLVFGDYCAGDGKPSPCTQELRTCQETWRNSVGQDPYCQAAASYLECTTKTSCSPDLSDMLISLRQGIDTQETKNHCPTEGSCLDRLIVCTYWQQNMNVTGTSNKAQYCILAKNANACFSYVRNDALCKTESITISPFETSLPTILQNQCGGAGGQKSTPFYLLMIFAVFIFSATRLL